LSILIDGCLEPNAACSIVIYAYDNIVEFFRFSDGNIFSVNLCSASLVAGSPQISVASVLSIFGLALFSVTFSKAHTTAPHIKNIYSAVRCRPRDELPEQDFDSENAASSNNRTRCNSDTTAMNS
jgi:hypothetical protein